MSERELYPWEVRAPVPEAPAPPKPVEVDDEVEVEVDEVPEDDESEE